MNTAEILCQTPCLAVRLPCLNALPAADAAAVQQPVCPAAPEAGDTGLPAPGDGQVAAGPAVPARAA